MDVDFRSALHPLLGRLRIGAPRLWPLSPELHTSDCSFACPGSSTWVDKVPSQDTPSLNLTGRWGGGGPSQPSGHTPAACNPIKVSTTAPRGRQLGERCRARPSTPGASS